MKLLFHNRRSSELRCDVGAGRGFHGIRLTKCRPCVGVNDSLIDRRYKVLLLNGRTPCEALVQELAYIHFPPVTYIRKQVL